MTPARWTRFQISTGTFAWAILLPASCHVRRGGSRAESRWRGSASDMRARRAPISEPLHWRSSAPSACVPLPGPSRNAPLLARRERNYSARCAPAICSESGPRPRLTSAPGLSHFAAGFARFVPTSAVCAKAAPCPSPGVCTPATCSTRGVSIWWLAIRRGCDCTESPLGTEPPFAHGSPCTRREPGPAEWRSLVRGTASLPKSIWRRSSPSARSRWHVRAGPSRSCCLANCGVRSPAVASGGFWQPARGSS